MKKWLKRKMNLLDAFCLVYGMIAVITGVVFQNVQLALGGLACIIVGMVEATSFRKEK